MSYQTLIVKDTRDVNKCWKWSIIVALLSVVATGLAVTFSFHALLDNFNTNCISGAKLVFKTTTDNVGGGVDDEDPSSASIASSSAASLTFVPPLLPSGSNGSDNTGTETSLLSAQQQSIVPYAHGQPNDDASSGNMIDGVLSTTTEPAAAASAVGSVRRWLRSRQNYSEQFREHFEPLMVIDAKLGVNKLRQMSLMASSGNAADDQRLEAIVRQQLARNEEDIEFFDSQMIDELNTFWGPMAPCEYISFVPLIEAIVAVVWMTMFMMCGNGGRSNETFVDEPWRIVLPAFVFFALMTIVSGVHLAVLLSRLAHFCSELKQNFHDQTVPCALLINQFSMNDEFAVAPSHNYVLAITFSWLRLAFWALAVAVMTARCVKGTDFELVELTSSASSSSSATMIASARRQRQQQQQRRRPLLDAVGGCTSESGGDELDTVAIQSSSAAASSDAVQQQQQQPLVQRAVRLTTTAKSRRQEIVPNSELDESDDDDNNIDSDDTDFGSPRTRPATTANVDAVAAGNSVHVNGVEFRPSSQMLGMRANPSLLSSSVVHRTPVAMLMGGSNCRRLVNEIDVQRRSQAEAARSKAKPKTSMT